MNKCTQIRFGNILSGENFQPSKMLVSFIDSLAILEHPLLTTSNSRVGSWLGPNDPQKLDIISQKIRPTAKDGGSWLERFKMTLKNWTQRTWKVMGSEKAEKYT
jgi:hypothetical protein